ncbi:MAG: MBL fold metallo-hydrolase [Oscillospiraceae bacterium]|jgi:phosphoribosyl 1,2-cyclic phosphodiesterase|nr:MBL fold metallo-hydrolase [Oscillospiraceae bacterium]
MEINVYASGSSGNAYRISDGKTTLLLDAGIPLRAIQVECGFVVRQMDGCLITHAHKDHSKAAEGLARLGVDIYTSAGTIAACGLTGHRMHAIKALEEVTIGTFQILAFDVQHDAPEPLGFLITSTITGERLLYFTDTYYIKYRFDGLTHIMAECNYDDECVRRSVDAGYIPIEFVPRLVKSHMSLEHFLEMLKANDLTKVRQIYLLHLSDNNSDAERFKEETQKATGAEVYVC